MPKSMKAARKKQGKAAEVWEGVGTLQNTRQTLAYGSLPCWRGFQEQVIAVQFYLLKSMNEKSSDSGLELM